MIRTLENAGQPQLLLLLGNRHWEFFRYLEMTGASLMYFKIAVLQCGGCCCNHIIGAIELVGIVWCYVDTRSKEPCCFHRNWCLIFICIYRIQLM